MALDDVQLTDDERAALDALIPRDQQTGNVRDDLIAASREAWRRRQENTRLGGAVLGALHRGVRSWRIVEFATDIPATSARRWATPPEVSDADRPAPQD